MSSVMSGFSDMILFNPYCKFEKLITIQIIDEKPEAWQVKQFASGHIASKWQFQESKPLSVLL